jgi:hypothetical protein
MCKVSRNVRGPKKFVQGLKKCERLALQFKNHAFIQEPYLVKNEARALCKVDVQIWGILLCRPSGNHPYEDLAKSGYKPDMKF